MLKRLFYAILFRAVVLAKVLTSPAILGATGAVFDERGRLLLVRHSYAGGWRFPGGGVGRGEAPQAALLRELHEEVGLEGGQVELVGFYVRTVVFVTDVIGFFRITGATIAFKPSLEIREAAFFPLDALPPDTAPAVRRRVAELQGAPVSPFW